MRNLEDIERDLAAARETLSSVKGTQAEVYSRIVGYYRSVRNWNLGKREEYGERRLFRISDGNYREDLRAAGPSPSASEFKGESTLLLFVRAACPGCPPAKAAASRLGIPVELVNADTDEGMAEAARHNVMSTPTAILFSTEGREIKRAANAEAIGRILGGALPESDPASEQIAV